MGIRSPAQRITDCHGHKCPRNDNGASRAPPPTKVICPNSNLTAYSKNTTAGGMVLSHSKFRKNGKSLYIDNWNPAAQKYIHICYLCGRKGYSPALEEQDFLGSLERKAIYKELTKMFDSSLKLDSLGRCEDCARRQDEKKNTL